MFESSLKVVVTADAKHPTEMTDEEREHLGLTESK